MFRKKLSVRLIASLSFIILFLFFASGYFTYREYLRLFTGEIGTQFAKASEQAAARVAFQIENIGKTTNFIVFHPYIEEILRRSAERDGGNWYPRLLDREELDDLVNQVSIDESHLISMYLYDSKGSGYFFEKNTSTVTALDERTHDIIMASLEGTNGEMVWVPVRVRNVLSGGDRDVIAVARYMKNKQQERYGTLILLYDRLLFASMLGELTEGQDALVYLADRAGRIIFANTSRPADELERSDMLTAQYATDRISGLTLRSGLSLESVRERSQDILHIALFSGIAGAVCAALMIFFTGRRLLQPLQTLVQGMTRLRAGRFDTRVRISTKDELAFLGENFNEMASNIEELVKEVYVRKLHEREAELTALQAQVNPHFLYNTLDTIYMKLYLGEPSEPVSELVLSLSGLLRYSLQHPNRRTTVRDEVEHTRKYIHIQRARIGYPLQTFFQIDERAEPLPTMRLLLQPLVENVFFHAFAGRTGIGVLRVKISIREADRLLCMEVIDNGRGMDEERLARIRRLRGEAWEEPGGAIGGGTGGIGGIGLKTVARRIRLTYGEPYGLEAESSPGEGTTMRLLLPIEETAAEGGSGA